MFKIIEQQIKDNGYDNHIYFGLTDVEIYCLKQILKKDYGYIDLIINFDDSKKLSQLINSIPKNLNHELIKSIIYEQYINYKILKAGNISDENIGISTNELENILFSDNFENFRKIDFILYMTLEKELKKLNKKTRLHLFLDDVNDILLQIKINDLIYSRQSLILMVYTVKDKLITHTTSNNSFIESPHDYRSFYKNKEKILK
ncbi:MAG: hypothetical protein IJO32_01550 [Bacilli bacterium]|nr:hypothetical protein [Bacilli bacterium]